MVFKFNNSLAQISYVTIVNWIALLFLFLIIILFKLITKKHYLIQFIIRQIRKKKIRFLCYMK